MRNLNKPLAIVSLLAPMSAHPLGIGDIKLHSALNQKLNAEIPLIVSKDENPANIRVSLAAPEKFDEAGVPWNYFLTKIKFNTQVRRDGSVVIKLTSNEALREPFLDFLLEVTWDKGNLYREFTVLVDPPSSYTQPVIPVAQTAVSPASAQTQTNKPATDATIRVENERLASHEYGPTRRSDTLWDIAARLRPRKDISIEQMVVALYEANPKAFYKKNVNALMAGKKLKIPDVDSILKLSRKQAADIFRQQYQQWQQKSTKAAKAQKTTSAAEASAKKTGSQLELIAPVESAVEESASVAALQASTEKSAEATKATAEHEKGSTAQLDNQALLARLEKLEQQLTAMQQLLAVKDAKLAALQQAGQSGAIKTATKAEVTAKPVEKSKTVVKKAVAKPVPKQSIKKPLTPSSQEEESSFFSDFYYIIVGGASILILGLLAWLWTRKRRAEEEMDADSMFSASSQIVMPDSEMNSQSESSIVSHEGEAYDVGTVGESSFLSEFTPSDFDAFDAEQSEVDPIAEADVYLAYGRYQQAEELMQQAIKEHPERKECKLKLLEIFYASENKAAFAEYLSELEQSGTKDEDPEFWAKAVEMQKELGLESSASDSTATASQKNDNEPNQDKSSADLGANNLIDETELDNISLDIFGSSSKDDAADNKGSAETDESTVLDLDSMEDLDFNLDSFASEDVEKNKTDEKVEDDIESLDFDLDIGTLSEEIDKTAPAKDDNEDLETFDFDTASEPVTQKPATEENADDESFDFDFNFEESSFEVKDEKPSVADGEVSDLTDMDEFETKLDLARAYIDMGDLDAARTIVDEVLAQGNEQQKKAAQEIIDSL
ncbi:FimV/HubP family polar landmark protein [methane-oxidizing endosymbiont of Gigantopelta aegis]|uniref:FimV/HubP family polar landmark protein n=1 Tax=methane-oxidizing endosymbiont of Gigantopelta aegis TaxID=2794938 RepID=UPI0018DBFBFA|nr:FimV/HubP family polar landmark protein [methane-oxidizing endosymbiont of Gigantopelta aegis]